MHFSLCRPLASAAVLAAAVSFLGGCPTPKQLAAMPGLEDVVPTSKAGKKCYAFCSEAQAECKEMCPTPEGICADDCIRDSKLCLQDCPDLQRQ